VPKVWRRRAGRLAVATCLLATLLSAAPAPAASGLNTYIVQLRTPAGAPAEAVEAEVGRVLAGAGAASAPVL
jgi:hypothetical protein